MLHFFLIFQAYFCERKEWKRVNLSTAEISVTFDFNSHIDIAEGFFYQTWPERRPIFYDCDTVIDTVVAPCDGVVTASRGYVRQCSEAVDSSMMRTAPRAVRNTVPSMTLSARAAPVVSRSWIASLVMWKRQVERLGTELISYIDFHSQTVIEVPFCTAAECCRGKMTSLDLQLLHETVPLIFI